MNYLNPNEAYNFIKGQNLPVLRYIIGREPNEAARINHINIMLLSDEIQFHNRVIFAAVRSLPEEMIPAVSGETGNKVAMNPTVLVLWWQDKIIASRKEEDSSLPADLPEWLEGCLKQAANNFRATQVEDKI